MSVSGASSCFENDEDIQPSLYRVSRRSRVDNGCCKNSHHTHFLPCNSFTVTLPMPRNAAKAKQKMIGACMLDTSNPLGGLGVGAKG